MTRAAWLALALLLVSCGEQATEIVLVVDTDLADAARFEVETVHPDGERGSSFADLAVQPPPRTLVLVHRGGELGPVRLRIAARGADAELVAVEREVRFEPGVSRTLRVFLAEACRARVCDGDRTCGDDGRCRPPAVAPCEYEGRTCEPADGGPDGGADGGPDAGVDAGPVDAGPCPPVVDVCGVAGAHLVGDRIRPAPCGYPATSVSVTDPDGAPLAAEGDPPTFVPVAPGSYGVRVEAADGACVGESSFVVSAPTRLPPAFTVDGELRGIGARVDAAFVASQNRALAVDEAGWHDLSASAAELSRDFRDVAMFGGEPVFGPNGDEDRVLRVEAAAPFDAVRIELLTLQDASANRAVRALATPAAAPGALAVATHDGVLAFDPPPGASPSYVVDSAYDPGGDGWIAVGAAERPGRGAVWVGNRSELYNFTLDPGASAVNEASSLSSPSALGDLRAAAIDDALPEVQRLWLCGSTGVALYLFPPGDWEERSELPEPAGRWEGSCADLTLDDRGDAWVATGHTALVRLDRDVVEIGRYTAEAGATLELVDAAWSGASRAVWAVDTAGPAAIRIVADARP